MTRSLDEDELIEHWTLVGEEADLVAGKRGATRLRFALMLKFHQRHGRFPRGRAEVPDEAVEYVAKAVKVPASEIAFYEWDGRSSKEHRVQIRKFTGFRECSVADADKATDWLATGVCDRERRTDRVRVALAEHLKDERIEPPALTRLQRIIASAIAQAESALDAADRLPDPACGGGGDARTHRPSRRCRRGRPGRHRIRDRRRRRR